MSKNYETVIGLEVHVELATKTKIFCGCSTAFGGAPNTHTCPVCTGMPGSLPVLNKQVVEYAMAVGLATNCDITQNCKFDRKNYFYPDNPQNYQISQLYLPICRNGKVEINVDGVKKDIRIHEIHMEEDAGKLVHDPWTGDSLVDFNRSGVPLIEIVSEPDMRSADEVIAYLEKLRLIIQYLGASDCKLQEGSMRADVNLSVREERQTAKDNLEIVKEGITKNSASFSSTMIRSTIDGLILDVPVKAGNSVIMSNTFNDGTTIATVANMNDMIFRGNIDETEVGRIHEQMPIKLTIGALQNLTFNAILEYISPKGVETNGANQFEIKAAITIPDSVQIRSGYSANAEIVLQRANQVLAVPESTIEFNGDSTFVYIMTDSVPEQKFQRTQVTAGMSDGIKIEIKKGITAQDKIRGAEKKDK